MSSFFFMSLALSCCSSSPPVPLLRRSHFYARAPCAHGPARPSVCAPDVAETARDKKQLEGSQPQDLRGEKHVNP